MLTAVLVTLLYRLAILVAGIWICGAAAGFWGFLIFYGSTRGERIACGLVTLLGAAIIAGVLCL